jgi:hypothetical protein
MQVSREALIKGTLILVCLVEQMLSDCEIDTVHPVVGAEGCGAASCGAAISSGEPSSPPQAVKARNAVKARIVGCLRNERSDIACGLSWRGARVPLAAFIFTTLLNAEAAG